MENLKIKMPATVRYILSALLLILCFDTFSQTVITDDVNYTTGNSSSVLDVKSESKGLLIPRMTAAQRGQISSPATGLLVFQTDGTPGFYYHNGSGWIYLIGSNAMRYLQDADADTKVQVEANSDEDKIRFTTFSNERMIIDNSGNVGIGTSSPGSKFEVSNGSVSTFSVEVPPSLSGVYNILVGSGSGHALTTGQSNLFAGYQSGYSNTTGKNSIGIGYKALYSQTG